MQLSNIRKLELRALGLAIVTHLVILLVYGITIIKHSEPYFSGTTVKINLAAIGSSPEASSSMTNGISIPTPTAQLATDSEGNIKTTPPIAMPTLSKKMEEEIAKEVDNEAPNDATEAKEAAEYLKMLQNIVQNKSAIPPEAALQNLSGKAVLRMEFDRKGNVSAYSLKTSTGQKILDDAALEVGAKLMKEPFPPAPKSFYPHKDLLKFDFGIDYTEAN